MKFIKVSNHLVAIRQLVKRSATFYLVTMGGGNNQELNVFDI